LDYGSYAIEILAEINNAPRLAPANSERQRNTSRPGAISSTSPVPGGSFPELATWCASSARRDAVSVDQLDPAEILTAVAAGAELVLSVNRSNLDVARELGGSDTRVVSHLILVRGSHSRPAASRPGAVERPLSDRSGDRADRFGFMASLERYTEVHRRYPTSAQLMGVGNITELTSADSTE